MHATPIGRRLFLRPPSRLWCWPCSRACGDGGSTDRAQSPGGGDDGTEGAASAGGEPVCSLRVAEASLGSVLVNRDEITLDLLFTAHRDGPSTWEGSCAEI